MVTAYQSQLCNRTHHFVIWIILVYVFHHIIDLNGIINPIVFSRIKL
ncbi:MAG: DUF3925 family protein [Flavobacteriaceae bacterium]|nr:DUF3925 family protein [Flavobacteriaceae bacterium]